MPQVVQFVSDDQTVRITPDALRVRLTQSGIAVKSMDGDEQQAEIVCDGVTLRLLIEHGFVVEIDGEITFVNDRKTDRLLELLESMGWVPVED